MVAAVKLITVEEIESLIDQGDSWELLAGELIETTPPQWTRGVIALRFGHRLSLFLDKLPIGVASTDSGFVVSRNPDSVLAPDISFVRNDRAPLLTDGNVFPELAPDLVVEIVSSGDRAPELHAKVDVYLRAGVRMVVVVWPKLAQVSLHRPDGTAVTLKGDHLFDTGDVLPGFSFPISELFA
ncbi:MAG: Uma2 family endonuclease [Thermomicrobiales bacterium]